MTGHRILLVEDDAMIALHTEDVLTDGGYVVVGPADDLSLAMTFAQTAQIDAAVLDVNLGPGIYVWPVAEILHARGIPFVLLTAFGAGLAVPAICQRAPRLSKPFEGNSLLEAVTIALRRADQKSRAPGA